MGALTKQEREEFLQQRLIATLATENEDGSIHLTAVWYLYENGLLYVGTASGSRKARNARARPKATLMIDARKPGTERGVTAMGRVKVIEGAPAGALNRRIHSRYLSAAALDDPRVGKVFAAVDDVTLQLTPERWLSWDMAALDAQVFGGVLGRTPGYLLPLD